MEIMTLNVEVPKGIMYALNQEQNEFISKMKLFTAVEYYREHKLSLGKAAELAGMQKTEFMFYLGEIGEPVINYSIEELDKELERFEKR